MINTRGNKRLGLHGLYPSIEPFEQRMLDRGDGHRIYVEQCGNPEGVPVVVLHGGPGGGCSPFMRRFFDPAHYRIILFDQRGCGRSRPRAEIGEIKDNTTWHLIADMEAIRTLFGLERWILFGGSWGASLALIYAITHPQRVAAQVLRGVFLMSKGELDWFYRGGAGAFWPDLWDDFLEPLAEEARKDPIKGYYPLLFSEDIALQTMAAQKWTAWECALASLKNGERAHQFDPDYVRAFARLECHYFNALGFLGEDDYILNRAAAMCHIPTVIVHGRYDMVCPPRAPWHLAQALGNVDLNLIADSGHALSEPGISAALLEKMDAMKATISFEPPAREGG